MWHLEGYAGFRGRGSEAAQFDATLSIRAAWGSPVPSAVSSFEDAS